MGQRPRYEQEELEKAFRALQEQLGVPSAVFPLALQELDRLANRYPQPETPRYQPKLGMSFAGGTAAHVENPRMPTGEALYDALGAAGHGMFVDPKKPLVPWFLEGVGSESRGGNVMGRPRPSPGETFIGPPSSLPQGSPLHWSQQKPFQRQFFQHPNDPQYGDPSAAGPKGYTEDIGQRVMSEVEKAQQALDKRLGRNPEAPGIPTSDEVINDSFPQFREMLGAFQDETYRRSQLPKAESFDPAQFETALQTIERKMAEAGHPIVRVAKPRTAEQQNALFQQGRGKPGKIVTDADGYIKRSRHQDGEAMDYAFSVNGQPSWGEEHPWNLLGQYAKELGLEWGGDWKGGPGQLGPDRPHVQAPTRPIGQVPQRAGGGTSPLSAPPDPRMQSEVARLNAQMLRDQPPGAPPVPSGPQGPQGPSVQSQIARFAADQIRLPPSVMGGRQTFEPPTMTATTPEPLQGPQNFDPPAMPTPELQDRPSLVKVPRNFASDRANMAGFPEAPFSAGDADMFPPEEAEAPAPAPRTVDAPAPPRQAGDPLVNQLLREVRQQEDDEDETAQEAPMPAWKRAITSIFNSLPDMITAYTAARYDRPDIADNWLKQKALRIESALEAAKQRAAAGKDNFDRRMKILDIEQTRATSRVALAQKMSDLNARVAKGELRDTNAYYNEQNMWGTLYTSFGGDYDQLLDAYPVPFIDKVKLLRDDFNEWWKEKGYNEDALDTAPFEHPLKPGVFITGWEAAKILGQYNPKTGKPILSVGPMTSVTSMVDGRPQQRFIQNNKLGTEGPFTPVPDYMITSQPTSTGGMVGQAWDRATGQPSGPPSVVPGASENKTFAAQSQEFQNSPLEREIRTAAQAVLQARATRQGIRDFIPEKALVDQLIRSQDTTDQAEVQEMLKRMREARQIPPTPHPAHDPWRGVKDSFSFLTGR